MADEAPASVIATKNRFLTEDVIFGFIAIEFGKEIKAAKNSFLWEAIDADSRRDFF